MTATSTQEGSVQIPGGSIYYRVVGSGNKIPLVAIHGGPGIPHQQLQPLEALAEERPIVFYDQLGCGESDWPENQSFWRIERFVEEVALLKDALALDKVHIFGHSWGSMVLVDYALRKPPGLVSLVLASPIISVPRWVEDQRHLRNQLPVSLRDVLNHHEAAGTTSDDEYLTAVGGFREHFQTRFLDPLPDAMTAALGTRNRMISQTLWSDRPFVVNGNLKSYDRSGRLHEIGIPTLFTCGRYDNSTPEATESYQTQLTGSEMVVFENSSHWPHFEETESFLETVRVFLRRVEQDASG